ncbi:C-type lectin domain family 17, member A-like [Carassius carassius]|uniref:C-type lectin domain family 17, member A-like n=1 Tax=Carassius carassius TaxID=217509 RepID=UPI0028686C78|nr:C-type lectin domain family 17, member A-like [Carassius carassius]
MSDGIHDNVIRTESERAEITVVIYESADCVRDHDLRTETNTQQPLQCTGSDSVKSRSSRTAVVCLVLLCVLLLTAVIVLCVHIHTNNTNYTQKRDQLLTKINSLTEERNQLLTNNSDHIQLNKLNQGKNEPFKCFNGMDGWLYYNFSFYYISSEMKNWTESRRYCTERGADLIIINNREEQKTVDKMRDGKTGFWIGLTDSEEEGNWKWVNGSTLTSG